MTLPVEEAAHRQNSAIHHVTGCNGVRSRTRVVQGDLRERLDRAVVVDGAGTRDDVTAMAMVRRSAKAHVRPDQQGGTSLLDRGDCLRSESLRIQCGARLRILLRGRGEYQHRRHARGCDSLGVFDDLIDRHLRDPGHALDGMPYTATRHDEQRVDESIGCQARLAHHSSPNIGLARSTRSLVWKSHHVSPGASLISPPAISGESCEPAPARWRPQRVLASDHGR